MKLQILIFSILLSPIFLKAQNLPACDSVFIDCCTFDSPTESTISIMVSNYSTNIFSYPGFILFTENMDTIAIETVNYFGIGWTQTHVLNIIHPFTLPFDGILELHTGFYDTQVCSFPITVPDTTLSQIENNTLNHLSIYPNPAHHYIYISNTEEREIKNIVVYNLSGNVVQKADNNHRPINIEKLETGFYFMEAYTEGGDLIREKFIKR